MGMSLEMIAARAFEEAQERLKRDGAQAPDLCIDEYMSLSHDHPRRNQLTRVIAALSMI